MVDVPEGYISLVDAVEQLVRVKYGDEEAFPIEYREDVDGKPTEFFRKNRNGEVVRRWTIDEYDFVNNPFQKAFAFLINSLQHGDVKARYLKNQPMELGREYWSELANHNDIYVSRLRAYDHPERGRALFLRISDAEELSRAFQRPSRPKKRGRPKGAKTYNDDPALAEMHRLITEGIVQSRTEAAREALHLAEGGGTDGSTQSRLYRAYNKKYGNKNPPN